MIDEPKRGRPAGTVESPDKLLWTELIQQIKLYRRCREIIEKRINDEGALIDPEIMVKYLTALRQGITEMARAVMPPANAGTKTPVEEQFDPQKFVQELLEGDTRR